MREQHHDDLASWERWPLAALFLANALNIFILYVPPEEMPPVVQSLLPWVRVACGIAAAASLEGTLIAVTMGRRLGRDSYWSWAAMFAASLFTALVAYYVHAAVGLAAAGLFMAQAVVLFIYTQHLATPRKTLHEEKTPPASGNDRVIRIKPAPALPSAASHDTAVSLSVPTYKCKKCEHEAVSLASIRAHHREAHGH